MFEHLINRVTAATTARTEAAAATTLATFNCIKHHAIGAFHEYYYSFLQVCDLMVRPTQAYNARLQQRHSIGASIRTQATKPRDAYVTPNTGRATSRSAVQIVTITTRPAQQSWSAFEKVVWFVMYVALWWLFLHYVDVSYAGCGIRGEKIKWFIAVFLTAMVPLLCEKLGY